MFPVMNTGSRPSVSDLLEQAAEALTRAGCATPRLDAELLLADCLGHSREWLAAHPDHRPAEPEYRRFESWVCRRYTREPVAYIRGWREFWSLELAVDRRALVPRPESETIIEAAQALMERDESFFFADIGTGSGCLAAALATEFPAAHGLACDVSAAALELAAQNLRRLGLGGRVECARGELHEPLPSGRCRLIVCNPPYIPSPELERLEREVRIHEPRLALDGGPDGLAVVRPLVAAAPARLAPGGWLLCEVGAGQAETVAGLCRRAGFSRVESFSDLAGVERVVAARMPCRR